MPGSKSLGFYILYLCKSLKSKLPSSGWTTICDLFAICVIKLSVLVGRRHQAADRELLTER